MTQWVAWTSDSLCSRWWRTIDHTMAGSELDPSPDSPDSTVLAEQVSCPNLSQSEKVFRKPDGDCAYWKHFEVAGLATRDPGY